MFLSEGRKLCACGNKIWIALDLFSKHALYNALSLAGNSRTDERILHPDRQYFVNVWFGLNYQWVRKNSDCVNKRQHVCVHEYRQCGAPHWAAVRRGKHLVNQWGLGDASLYLIVPLICQWWAVRILFEWTDLQRSSVEIGLCKIQSALHVWSLVSCTIWSARLTALAMCDPHCPNLVSSFLTWTLQPKTSDQDFDHWIERQKQATGCPE